MKASYTEAHRRRLAPTERSNREIFAQGLKCFADPQRRNEYFHFYSPDTIVHGYQGIEANRLARLKKLSQ